MFRSLAIVMLIVCATSCKKEGCLDRNARNFDVAAKKSGTCYYDGRVILYNGTDGTNAYANTTLEYYFNGVLMLVDSNLPQTASEPLCDDPLGKTFTLDLDVNTAMKVNYQIKNQATKAILADSAVTVAAAYCVPHKIRLK